METLETRIRVRYAETDQMGVVYYANYLIWMEVGRVELCRATGIRYRDMEIDDDVMLVVAEANCRYLAPARYDDEVAIRTTIGNATPRMVRFDYEVREAASGRSLATGFSKHDSAPCMKPRTAENTAKVGRRGSGRLLRYIRL
jgi:acyl-CoA thioester hydrolase